MVLPTYGFLIDAYHEHNGNRDKLIELFRAEYPDIYIRRPDCLYRTIERIVFPTIPTAGKRAVCSGSQLLNYRKRLWKPRLRNTTRICGMFNTESVYNIHML